MPLSSVVLLNSAGKPLITTGSLPPARVPEPTPLASTDSALALPILTTTPSGGAVAGKLSSSAIASKPPSSAIRSLIWELEGISVADVQVGLVGIRSIPSSWLISAAVEVTPVRSVGAIVMFPVPSKD